MFPELVGRVCIKAAICGYHGCRLAERTFTPYAIVTSDNLDEYYQRNENRRRLGDRSRYEQGTF